MKGTIRRLCGVVAACVTLLSGSAAAIAGTGNERIVFLHHSTGGVVWDNGVPEWFTAYNAASGTNYAIEERWYPGSGNYPFEYWNVWVNHAGNDPYLGDDTLEILTQTYDVIAWKHCYPVSEIEADVGSPDVTSDEKRQENYRLQYEALKAKMRSFPKKTFIVWTGAVHVQSNISLEQAERMRNFTDWVRNTWDEPGDNIFVWDFYELETEGGLYLRDEYSAGEGNSHPNAAFAGVVAPLFGQAIVDAINATPGKVPADFNADGKPDMLFQEMTAKQLYAWYMNGVARSGGSSPNPKTVSNSWKVVSTADFNADGKPDILLQEMSAKQLYVWYMNGVTRTGGSYLNPKTVSNNWRVAAAADFNADGKPDILLQEHSTKQLYVWYMNGVNRTGGAFLNPKTVSNNWKVVGAADMNGDGKPDIVLQEASTKQLYVWYMNGVNRTGGAFLNPKTVSNDWKVVAVQDMNGDGKPDLVLQEFTTQQLYVWYMNGINRTGGAFLNPNTIGGAWRAVGGNGAWLTLAAASSVATETPEGTDNEGKSNGARTTDSAASGQTQTGGCNVGAGAIAVLLLMPAALAGIRRK